MPSGRNRSAVRLPLRQPVELTPVSAHGTIAQVADPVSRSVLAIGSRRVRDTEIFTPPLARFRP